ncbi:ABC transporter substrate-binding protein [Arthrobacter sp. UYEF3]|uniref:ABC transporter substrate-binding protein n=1 Tax=Arthrobacter sp. UYEF3 TaxID=1756365 RepID=UPI0033955D10
MLVLTAGLVGLTACTTASQSAVANTPSGGPAFNPLSVTKDDALAASVPAAIRSKGTLTIGSDTTFPPAESLGGSDGQTAVGYDVDLAKAIGTKLGLKVSISTADFPSILPSLGTKYDLGVSSFFITNERLKAVNLVSYFQGGTQWAVQKGNPKNFDLDNVCGKNIGVQSGSFQETEDLAGRNAKCISEGKPAINIVSLKSQTDVSTRLVAGGIDAMPAASITIAYAITQSGGQLQALGDVYGASPVGIAVAKNDIPLADAVAKAVNKLMADGDYKKILDAWGNGSGAIDHAKVNPDVSK